MSEETGDKIKEKEKVDNSKLTKKEKAEIYIGPIISSVASGLITGLIVGAFTLYLTFGDNKKLVDLNNSFQTELVKRSEKVQKDYYDRESLSKLNDEIMNQVMELNKTFARNLYIRDNGTTGFKDAAEHGLDFNFAVDNLNEYKIEKLKLEFLLDDKNDSYEKIEKELKNMNYFLVIDVSDESFDDLKAKKSYIERTIKNETNVEEKEKMKKELNEVTLEYEKKKKEKDLLIKNGEGVKLDTLKEYIANNQLNDLTPN